MSTEILNHLEDLSEFGIEWLDEDKEILVEFQNKIIDAGFIIKYLNTPLDMTEDGIITALALKTEMATTGNELFQQLHEHIMQEHKYNFIFNKTIYIYQMSKLNCQNAQFYKIRIGSQLK